MLATTHITAILKPTNFMKKFYTKLLVGFLFVFGTVGANAQTTYYSKAAATDFNDVNSWGIVSDGSGAAPASISNADNFVVGNGAVMTLSATANVRALYIGSFTGFPPATATGSLLVVVGNTINVGGAAGNNYRLGIGTSGNLTVSGGNINIKGDFRQTAGILNQSGGIISVDGNDAGNAATSVVSGTSIFYTAVSGNSLTGGSIIIVDPHANSTASLSFSYDNSSTNFNAGTNHTFQFGDGTSITPGGNIVGFSIDSWTGSNRFAFGNLIIQGSPSGANRICTIKFTGATPAVDGNLTITANGDLQTGTTTFSVAGNITNDGNLLIDGVLALRRYQNATSSASTTLQTISGSGTFKNAASSTANFAGLTIQNTSAGGVTFSNANSMISGANTGTVSGALTFTSGVVNTGGNPFVLGTGIAALGSYTWTAGGFGSGSMFGKWFATGTAGSTISASTIPTTSSNTGFFPFINGSNSRQFFMQRPTTAGSTGGVIRVLYSEGAGGLTTIADVVDAGPPYTLNRQSTASWTVSTSNGFAAGTGTFNYAASGIGIYSPLTATARLMLSASVTGTHQAGTTLPHAQRTAISAANFANQFYIGVNSADVPVTSAQTGPWETGSTWVGGVVPISTQTAIILSTHNVTVSGTTGSVTVTSVQVNSGGTLTITGGALTIGATNFNNVFTNNGTSSISAGALNINGNLNSATGSTFAQTGGTITVDGNDNNIAGTSVATGTPIVHIQTGTVTLSGGSLIIVDPHVGSATTDDAFRYTTTGLNVSATTGHTLQLGNGSSTQAGGNAANGFSIHPQANTGALLFRNVIIDANTNAGNRFVATRNTSTSGLAILGNLTITSGEARILASTTFNVAGNVSNAGTLTTIGTIGLQSVTGTSVAVSANAQTVSGAGTFQNLTASPTANFTNITINNSNATGVTFSGTNWNNAASTASGALTFTAGRTNIGAANIFTLGVSAAAAGTLAWTAGGFTEGTFRRWIGTATITLATNAGKFPFVGTVVLNANRNYDIGTSGVTTGNTFSVTYTDGAGSTGTSPFTDNGASIGNVSTATWAVSQAGILPTTATLPMRVRGDGIASLAAVAGIRITGASASVFTGATSGIGTGTTANPEANKSTTTVNDVTASPTTLYFGTGTPYATAQSGNWEDGTTWVGGFSPGAGCSEVVINANHTVTVNGSAASCSLLQINALGAVTVSGSSLTVGCTNNNNTLNNNGTLTVSGGNLIVNGNIAINNGSSFTHSSGTITIDGNNNSGTVGNASSVASGTPLFGIGTSGTAYGATGTVTLSGGTIIITDPHIGSATNTNAYAVYANMASSVFANAATTHTFQFGDGVSTAAGGNISGFYVAPFIGSGRLNFGNLTANSAAGTNRNVVQIGTSVINGNLTGTLGTYDQGTSTTNIGGNINIGSGSSFITGGTVVFASVTGTTTSAQTVAQSVSVSGIGTISNLSASPTANFTTITINNTSATGVTFNSLNAISGQPATTSSVSGTLTFTAGKITTAAGNKMILGTSVPAAGTLTVTAGGFASGSTYGRWSTATSTGTGITAGIDPATTTSRFPFINGSGVSRSIWLERVTATVAGVYAVTYNDAATNSAVSINDGGYTVETRFDGNWTFSTLGTSPVAATYKVAIVASGIYGAANGNSRVTLAATPVGGTHQNGTTTPGAQRIGLTLAQLTAGPLYIGINNADVPFISVANGNWEDGTTWNKNPLVPTATDAVIIANATTVTVNATASAAAGVTINSGGTLTMSANALNITNTLVNNGTFNASGGTTTVTAASGTGITNGVSTGTFNVNGGTVNLGISDNTICNRTFTNNGNLTVSAGTLNVFGNIVSASGSLFNQSGGNINIDGNAAGVAANSVSSGTALLQFNQLNSGINLTGGTLTIVDPHANSTLSNVIGLNNATTGTQTSTIAHTTRFGNGVSTDAGGSTSGFLIDQWTGSAFLQFGNIIVLGPAGTNRNVSSVNQLSTLGNVTVNSGGVLTLTSSSLFLGGNLTVDAGGTFTSTIGVSTVTVLSNTISSLTTTPATVAQTLGGAGTYQNLAASPTANLTNLTVNNTHPSGVTIGIPLSVSGTLTLTAGLVNTTSTNLLRLGTATAAGTLIGTPSATNMIVGPFARTFAASRTATGTYTNATLYPVGKGATYLPINIDPSTNAGGSVVLSGEAFTSNSGTLGTGVTSLSTNRWEALVTTGSANFTNSFIRLTDGGIAASNKILQSLSAAGAYTGIPVASTYAAGPPVTLTTATSVPTASYLGYFAYGNLTNCIAPADQPTVFGSSNLTTTSFTGSFILAASTPSHYLVVRYPSGGSAVAPVDFTSYTVGGTLGTGTIVANVVSPSNTYNATGLTANTTYDIYIYSYNNGGCFGPVYNITSPLTGSVTTCAAVTGTPGTPTSSLITSSSFTASWTASSTSGVDYILDVATNNTFTTFVSGYNALNVGTGTLTYNINTGLLPNTTYYVRVRAVIGGCTSANSGTLTLVTECSPFTPVYTQDFATYVPSCWKEQTGYLTNTPSSLTGTSSAWTSDGWLNSGSTGAAKINLYDLGKRDWLISPSIDLGGLGNYQLEFDLATLDFGGTSAIALGSDDSLAVVISTNNGTTWSTTNILNVWTAANTPVTATGLHVTIPLTSYSGIVKIGFYGSEGLVNDIPDVDVMIDNFAINLQPACTVPTGVSVGSITSTSASVSFTSAGSNFIVEYGATGFTPGTGAAPGGGTIVTGVTSPITISSLTAGNSYDVFVRQVCAGPIYSANSSPAVNFTTPLIVSSFPYCEGFEGSASGWSKAILTGSINDWVIGTPAKTQITGAHGGTKAYVTLTTGTYNNDENAYVKSPVFDFSALAIDPKLSFWSNFKTETGWDAGIVEYSTDGGTTWAKLDANLGTGGTFNTTNSTNWYNNSSSNGPITPPKWSSSSTAYTGHASGWINSVSNLVGFKGSGYSNVQFRWRFGSDGSSIDEGWAIDDICVTAVDDVPPAITYTGLGNTSCLTDRNITATITDGGIGVNTTAGTKPRLYFKKSADANNYVGNTNADNGWKYVEASNSASPFSFTTNYLLLQSALAQGDIIQYFVVAQDMAATPNVGINSGTFNVTPASVALTGTAFPIGGTINQYTIVTSFSTDVTVGAAVDGGTYPTLTGTGGLFEALNSGSLNANISAKIVSTSITEPGTVALNAINYGGCSASGPYTLTIKPNTGVNSILTGSNGSGAIIKLNGADYVVIDGSNNGSSSRNLTIANTNTATSGNAVFWIASASASDGATNNTIKNCIITGNSSITTLMSIFSGGTASISTTGNALFPNTNNTIQNNTISKSQYGIFVIGVSTASLGSGLTITGNSLGSATASDGFLIEGIDIRLQTGATLSNNDVQNITGTSSSNMQGINLQDSKLSTVSANKVHFMNYTGSSTTKVYGITTSTSTFNVIGNQSANTYVNNIVYDLASTATSTLWNTSGINNNGGYNDKYYFNSVYLTGQMSNGTAGSAAFSNGNGISSTNCPVIDIRNNIFDMNGSSTAAATLYSHYTTLTTYSGSTLNYNDLLSAAAGSATAQLGRFNGANVLDLAAWQSATSLESNSISVDPLFTSTTNLSILGGSPAIGAGTSITGITTDINGSTRNNPPTIGAYENKIVVVMKMFLQGAYSTGLSRHKDVSATWASVLNANALSQPYNTAAFGNYAGTETVTAGFFTSTAATTDIVDWVLVELRDAVTPTTIITRRAAFIREDGLIVDLDGVSSVSFKGYAAGNYFVVIRHRNHLGVRTAATQLVDGSATAPATYNFSSAQTQAYQDGAIITNAAMKDLGGGVFGMWGGNANSNASVRASGPPTLNDYLYLINTTLGGDVTLILSNVYNSADMNMDGTVRASGPPTLNDYLFLINSVLSGNVTIIINQHQ